MEHPAVSRIGAGVFVAVSVAGMAAIETVCFGPCGRSWNSFLLIVCTLDFAFRRGEEKKGWRGIGRVVFIGDCGGECMGE